MRLSFKMLLIALGIAFALSAANLKYDIRYMNDATRMSEQAVAQIVTEGLSAEISKYPYYEARVNVYTPQTAENDYFVVYLFRSDIYFAPCFKLEIENSKVSRIVEDYIEEQIVPDVCATCPDPDVQALVSVSTPEFSTATQMRDSVANITTHAGLKTVKLDKADETLQNVQNYLVCPKLKVWARVGHGTTSGIILGSGTFNSSAVTALGANALQGKMLHFNSCDCHTGTFESTILGAGCYVYCGGDIPLAVGNSEKVTMKFMQKIIKEKKEINQSLKDAMSEVGYTGFGISGQGNPPWYITTGPYLTVNFPNGGESVELGTTQTIAWGDNIDGNVKIEILKGGSLKEVLAASVPSNGAFQWSVPANYQTGTDYLIKITSIDSAALNDQSNSTFSVIQEYLLTVPYTQTFDTLDTGEIVLPFKWEQQSTDDMDWIVWQGPTPTRKGSSTPRTGASADHTSGSAKYIYVEATSNSNKKATYTTPKFRLSNAANPVLSFWYHMFSDNTMGKLYLDICVDGAWKDSVVQISGNKGDQWLQQTVNLNTYKCDRVIFRFRATTGTSSYSDICIDDFKIDGTVSINNTLVAAPLSYSLKYYQPRICYQVPEQVSGVSLKLYDMKGKLIRTLYNGVATPGYHFITMDNGVHGRPVLSEGLYLCRMEAGDFSETIKMVVKK